MRCYNTFCFLKWELLYYMLIAWELVLAEIHYSIPEELQRGAFIGNIADDLGVDVKQLAARNFRLVSGERKQYLEVDLNNGILFVKEKIDREELCGPSLTCVLSLEAVLENPLNLYQIEVDILDTNDNSPSFPKSQIRLKISELTAPGARFPLECAHDPDIGTNSVQTYQLVANEYFALNVEAGIADWKLPVLVLEQPLDREKHSTHTLLLLAKDGGVPERSGTAQINIAVEDANDNTPVFSQSVYKIGMLENATQGTLVLQVNATDLDDGSNGEILYSFSSHTSARVREIFGLDSQTGEIKLNANLDYEENNAFDIIIQAKDRGSHATAVYSHILLTIVDVNDNAPEITLTSLSSPVPENSPPGTVVALISASDRDSGKNGQIQCQVRNEVPFMLDSSSKKHLRLLTRDLLDRESTSMHNVTITCIDGGIPPLTANKSIPIEVSDRNDNSPEFSQTLFTAYVMENNNIGASIFSVTAFDPDLDENARISYDILESWVGGQSVNNYIYINSETGIIYSYRSFDYEQLKTFQIQIQARDHGVPSLSSNVSINVIILDQNDNAPVIVHPLTEHGPMTTEVVSRFAEAGYPVTKVTATDADSGQNARLCYRILQATDLGLFTISEDTGEIWTTRAIAKTDTTKQTLVVQVKQPNTDWRLSQTHRAELNSSQYLEEEGVQREIQCEVQREVQRDVQREVPRDVQCDVPRNVQRDLQRDVHCDVQHVAENDPGGPRKPMCARPPAIPAGRDGWTLPRTAPRMQLQMTLGTHVPGTLRSQYLFPREPCTPGARISNSNVEFSAFPIGSLHCPWAANQTRDHRGLTHPGSRRPELDTEACGEIPCSPSSLRLSTQRLHSRDHHHALRQVNN
ncbi:protocadherin-10-like isoform X18 [Pristis pectinata]|uniref:protocadherin-10-like isoform X18 n=1 Tax=Pristis pectinata TaxID=685728 RepID=UPI00223D7010|nr:protocadherin-10-like isoform X18 [Pristis pectinata]